MPYHHTNLLALSPVILFLCHILTTLNVHAFSEGPHLWGPFVLVTFSQHAIYRIRTDT